ncbi:MAG: cache domain-containing protein [bacterium]|nr:cache domain-containing protein [bacterium]
MNKLLIPRKKGPLLIIAVFIVLFFIAILLFLKIIKSFPKTIIQSFHTDQLNLVRTVAIAIQRSMKDLDKEITHLSAEKDLQQEKPKAYAKLFQDFYRLFSDKINSICKIDQNGRVEYIYPIVEHEVDKILNDMPCIKQVFRNGKPSISNCFFTKSKDYVILMSYPIFPLEGADKRKVIGVLCCIIHMDTFTDFFLPFLESEKLGMQTESSVWIINQKGLIVYHPDSSLLLKNYWDIIEKAQSQRRYRKAKSQKSPCQDLRDGKEAFGIYPFWGKDQELYAFTPLVLDSTKWLIGITTPYTSLYNPIRDNTRNILLLIFILLSIFFSGGISLSSSQ